MAFYSWVSVAGPFVCLCFVLLASQGMLASKSGFLFLVHIALHLYNVDPCPPPHAEGYKVSWIYLTSTFPTITVLCSSSRSLALPAS
ncbi:hypothetical protein BKA65DRAFT_486460 [Rhexocercosporidium sp. MPI-PUGE-AT-0058]|nr:hypothetical protein BKA65DRAFT_486460 [Rhexocercosporidium sp. MPI-PUGE-AT-0058]